MARNRKRAKERRARRPQAVASARHERDDAAPAPIRHAAPDAEAPAPIRHATPDAEAPAPIRHERDDGAPPPILHATPDAELAEAQMALGRPDLAGGGEPELDEDELGIDDLDAGDALANGAGFDGESPPPSGGGELAAPGGATPAHRARPGSRLITFLQGSWRELQRVQWPDRRQVMQATGVVIGFVIVAGVFLGVADTLASKLMTYILGQ